MRSTLLLFLAMPALAAPGLLLNSNDIERIRQTAASQPWAAEIAKGLVAYADAWPDQHVREFGLAKWELPKASATSRARRTCVPAGSDYRGWEV